jgi:hypothetical protein
MKKGEHVGALVQKRTVVRSKELKGLSVSHLWDIAKAGKIERVSRGLYAQKKPQSPSVRPSSKLRRGSIALRERDANRCILVRGCKPVFVFLCGAEKLLHLVRCWRCWRTVRSNVAIIYPDSRFYGQVKRRLVNLSRLFITDPMDGPRARIFRFSLTSPRMR